MLARMMCAVLGSSLALSVYSSLPTGAVEVSQDKLRDLSGGGCYYPFYDGWCGGMPECSDYPCTDLDPDPNVDDWQCDFAGASGVRTYHNTTYITQCFDSGGGFDNCANSQTLCHTLDTCDTVCAFDVGVNEWVCSVDLAIPPTLDLKPSKSLTGADCVDPT